MTQKKKYEGETTEKKFSMFCRLKGYFRIKLQVDKSNKSKEGEVIAKSMPSDFLVITQTQAKFVEVKEILKLSRFVLKRLRQQYKLTKISVHYPNVKIMDGYVLLYFVAHDVVCYMSITDYNNLVSKSDKKSLHINDIPNKFKFTWGTLVL